MPDADDLPGLAVQRYGVAGLALFVGGQVLISVAETTEGSIVGALGAIAGAALLVFGLLR